MNEDQKRTGFALRTAFRLVPFCLAAAAASATAQIERVSLTDAGLEADQDSYQAALSDDGSVVAFRSSATNLVADDTNGWSDIFVRDLAAGTTERVSFDPDGDELFSGLSHQPSLSDDGLIVAFTARHQPGAETSVTGLYDRSSDTSRFLLQDTSDGGNPMRPSFGRLNARISGNGQFVVFDTRSTLQNVFETTSRPIDDDNNATFDVFIHDVVTDPPPQVDRLSRDGRVCLDMHGAALVSMRVRYRGRYDRR